MSSLKDYYAREQKKKDNHDAIAEIAMEDKQIQVANNLRDLIALIIKSVLILAETVRPEAFPISWRKKRKLNIIQASLGVDAFKNYNSFAWDIGSGYFLTIDGKLLIQRRRNRDYRDDSYYYVESFPDRGSLDDPYSACERLIDFMEGLGAPEDTVSKKRNTLKLIKNK